MQLVDKNGSELPMELAVRWVDVELDLPEIAHSFVLPVDDEACDFAASVGRLPADSMHAPEPVESCILSVN